MLHQHRPRVAIIGTNDPRNFSGGRYHGLMLAYAIAATGGEAHVITDHVPGFAADLEPLAPDGVTIHQTPDFATGLPDGAFDWVIIIPTGIFLPDFYESCLDFTARVRARLALVNFESGNWFNAEAPQPRDPRIWDYWRRVCVNGALVLSSTRISHEWAKPFYTAPEGALRFEVWSPPVNTVAAHCFDGLEKDGSILAFIRPQDAHKGSSLLTQLAPELYANRTLRLVSGRDVPEDFAAAMQAHLAKAENARLEILLRISDLDKFRLMTMAQAVLATTQFEGFGYPPVEAAYAGTEAVCYDLPVLRETVGKIAHFAPSRDIPGLETALAAALRQPERRGMLRDHVRGFADFDTAAWRLADILLRGRDRIAPMEMRRFRVAIGPFAATPLMPAAQVDRHAATPPFPPYVVSAVTATGGDILITGRANMPSGTQHVQAVTADGLALPVVTDIAAAENEGFLDTRFHIIAPKDILQRRLTVTASGPAGPLGAPIELQIGRVAAASDIYPAVAGIDENSVTGTQRRIRGWVLAHAPVTAVWLRPHDGEWRHIAVTGERQDVLARHPGYASARCAFTGDIAAHEAPDRAHTPLLCMAGPPGRQHAVDLLVGWPPAPGPYFAAAAAAEQGGKTLPAAPQGGTAPRLTAAIKPVPRRPGLGQLELVNRNNKDWTRGIARSGEPGRLGSILAKKSEILEILAPGSILRFNSGAARRVAQIETQDNTATIVLDGPLEVYDNGFPYAVDILDPAWTPPSGIKFTLGDASDAQWWKSIWNQPDIRYRQGFILDADMAEALGLAPGARLRFAASGARRVIAAENDGHGNRQIWLNNVIRPLGDGAPHEVIIELAMTNEGGQLAFNLARAGTGWPGGILAQNTDELWAGQAILLAARAEAFVQRGTLLRFAHERVLLVTGVIAMADGLQVTLDGTLDPAQHGHPMMVYPADAADLPDGIANYTYANAELRGKDPLFFKLSTHARRHGTAIRPVAPSPVLERRVLFVSLVSPSPANQGNRVVTRNLIRHMVELGFQCDVIVQNWVDGAAAFAEFGPAVRLLTVTTPKWDETHAARLRRSLTAEATQLRGAALDAALAPLFERAAESYHPYFIVRDETVDLARALYAQHDYSAVICNYTHMARVALELQTIRPLPPTALITHDALSRLPRELGGKRLDLSYRPCPAALERDVLNAIPHAVVVAISSSEAAYFQDIGVENRIVLTEYDAAEEMQPYRIPETAFAGRRIIFSGSANPMNLAGLDWFIDECWAAILALVPDARLIVCGRAGVAWKANIPGVELPGELSRDDMMRLCATASMTINPCVAGTGLKIKTVEAACLGLPAVCLPAAVDGLEDVAAEFAIVARDGQAFAAGCIALLTDAALWSQLRAGALHIAGLRFSGRTVYKALDEALGLNPLAAGPARPLENAARHGDAGVALQAAAALEAGEFWHAVILAAGLIAQRPDLGEGYRLIGRGLLGCKLPHDAVAALEQGALAAPWNEAVLAALDEALTAAGRQHEARGRRTHQPAYDSYVPLDGRVLRQFVPPGRPAGDGACILPGEEAGIWIVLPETPAEHMAVSIDIRRPDRLAHDIEIELTINGHMTAGRILADGAQVQTIQAHANVNVFEANGVILLRLKLALSTPLDTPLSIIGYLLEERERFDLITQRFA